MKRLLIIIMALLIAAPDVFPQRVGVGVGVGFKRKAKTAVSNQYTTSYAGTEYYVASAGNDSNNGTTPATAWKTLS